jgi:alanine racemase
MSHLNRRDFLQSIGLLPLSVGAFLRNELRLLERPAEQNDYSSGDPWLEISLRNVAWNVEQIRKKVHGRPIMAVLKCNAYGHGLVGIAKFLEELPVHSLAVGKLSEAIALRRAGVMCPVLNFGPFSGEDAETIIRHKISQAVYDDGVLSLDEWAKKSQTKARVHIDIDTGLGRVGICHTEALNYIKRVAQLESIEIEGVFQTFSEDKEFDAIQLQRFLGITDKAKRAGITVDSDMPLRAPASSVIQTHFIWIWLGRGL